MWMFGDTLFVQASVDGTHARSSTAALAPINDPYNISEPLDANGAPSQFIPFNAEEEAWNVAHRTNEPNNRWIKWPTDAVNTSPTEGYVFYRHLRSTYPNNQISLDEVGIGIAKVTADSTTAVNVNESLFGPNEPHYVPTVSHDGTLYLEDCSGVGGLTFDYECSTAKVALDKLTERGAYLFWNGSSWTTDINSAAKDRNNPQGKIVWSEYLQKYIQFYHRGFSTSIVMKTANSPEGPWSDSEYVYSGKDTDYVAIFYMHPELFSEDGKTLVLSVNKYSPDDGKNGIFTLKINLANDADARPKPTPTAPKTGRLVGAMATFVATIGLIVWGAREVDSRKRITRKSSR